MSPSSEGVTFSQIATVGAGVTTYTDNGSFSVGATYYYQVIATNSVGNSPVSNVASVTIQNSTNVTTYVSDLAWVSATIGYGSIGKNVTVKGNPITLRGAVYAVIFSPLRCPRMKERPSRPKFASNDFFDPRSTLPTVPKTVPRDRVAVDSKQGGCSFEKLVLQTMVSAPRGDSN